MTDWNGFDPAGFSLEQAAGQRLVVGFEGFELNDDLRFLIDTFKVAGIILFSDNIASPGQVERLCRESQEYARICGQPPLIIAIDQEGGQVARLKKPFTIFPGNPHMNAVEDAVRFARVTARELLSVGVNMNMAPVLDVAPREIQSVMAQRAFGYDPRWVARMGAAVIDNLQASGIMAVAKHFPGIGRTTLDSHVDLPRMEASRADMEAVDLPPFAEAIRHRVAGCMLSHVLYPGLDPQWPASLSPRIARDLLRREMGYEGVVMTDDLDMGAVARNFDISMAVRQALRADIDLTLICHKSPAIETAFREILAFHADGDDRQKRARQSLERILAMKRQYLIGG